MEINSLLKQFIESKLVSNKAYKNLSESDPLLTTGIIDSLGIVKLLTFIKDQFSVTIADEDITPENFATIDAISSLIQSKKN
jgi:acyl carrier protein